MSEDNRYYKLTPEQLKQYIDYKEIYIVDTREIPLCQKGYIGNSIIIPLSMSYTTWLPKVIKSNSYVILITDNEHLNESLYMTASLNIYYIIGYALYDELISSNLFNIETIEYNDNTKEEIEKIANYRNVIIDVREINEFKNTGIIKEALLLPLSCVNDEIYKIPQIGNIYVYCRSGMRAVTYMTYAKRAGYKNKIIIMEGGMLKAIQEGFPLVPFSG